MECRRVAHTQEEEHPGDILLVEGEILRCQSGVSQQGRSRISQLAADL